MSAALDTHRRNLESIGAARQAALDDKAILLDHADIELWLASGKANFLLEAQKFLLSFAAHEHVVKVAGLIAANGCPEYKLWHGCRVELGT